MMKRFHPWRIATLTGLALSSLLPINAAKAVTFEETALEQSEVIAIARPYGENKYDLLVIQQIPGKNQCWAENGANPVIVDPLLLNFNFSGHCSRATDSNGYSIRIDGQDYGLDYLLRLEPSNGELLLVGTPRKGNGAEILVGRTYGLTRDFMKIILEPGWQFSKRAYGGKVLGHFYFSGNSATIASSSGTPLATSPETAATNPSTTTSLPFTDLTKDTYKTEIEKAVAMGFVSGFEDNTFRPEEPVTREQFISMAIDAMNTVYKIDLDAEPERQVALFTDVEETRWSAKKIQWAQNNFLVIGNPNGTLQPEELIDRAEMVEILRRITDYLKTQLDLSPTLQQTQTPVAFSDLSGHWAETVVVQMSGYCGIATPLNETGTEFVPDQPTTRNYAAAALVRVVECVKTEVEQVQNTSSEE